MASDTPKQQCNKQYTILKVEPNIQKRKLFEDLQITEQKK